MDDCESPVSTPLAKDKDTPEDFPPMESGKRVRLRSLAARANYLAMDRPDLAFAAKELCRRMSAPLEEAWRWLVGLAHVCTSPVWS